MFIKNVFFSPNKNLFSSLILFYGIGFVKAKYICDNLGLDCFKKNKHLSENDYSRLHEIISYLGINDSLKKNKINNINRLISIKCYRGVRHLKKLPVRGQNTKNNARTSKGSKKSIFFKKKINVKIQKKKNKKK